MVFLFHRGRDKSTGKQGTVAFCFCDSRGKLAPSHVPSYPKAEAAALTRSWISVQLLNLKAAIGPPLKLTLLQAKQGQLPQPFHLRQVLQPKTSLLIPLWDASSIFLVVGDPKLDKINSLSDSLDSEMHHFQLKKFLLLKHSSKGGWELQYATVSFNALKGTKI